MQDIFREVAQGKGICTQNPCKMQALLQGQNMNWN